MNYASPVINYKIFINTVGPYIKFQIYLNYFKKQCFLNFWHVFVPFRSVTKFSFPFHFAPFRSFSFPSVPTARLRSLRTPPFSTSTKAPKLNVHHRIFFYLKKYYEFRYRFDFSSKFNALKFYIKFK